MTPRLCFTFDTEPDNLWVPSPTNRFEHFGRLLSFHNRLASLGCRPTYLTTSEVVEDRAARRVMQQILETDCAEVGAHFHTWTREWPFPVPELGTPPVPALADRLGQQVEEQMLDYTCNAIREHLGVSPVSHRGGRWSLNGDSIRSLENCGILVDSTVVPGREWFDENHPFLNGPDSRLSTRVPHYLQPGSLQPRDDGCVLELPMGAAFRPNRQLALSTRLPIRCFRKLSNLLGCPMGHIWLRPAFMSMSQLRVCLRDLLASQIEVWVIMIHSSELGPNAYFSEDRHIEAFIQRCCGVVEDAIRLGAIPATMKEVWELFDARKSQAVSSADGRRTIGGDDHRVSARQHHDPH